VLAVPSYLLRIQLVDRPGSLGSLAVALGSVGADILSLDVVERSAGSAIDDLVIELPPGAMPDTLITAAESLPGSGSTACARIPVYWKRTASWSCWTVSRGEDKEAKLRVLVNETPRVLRVSWCTVLRNSQEVCSTSQPVRCARDPRGLAPWFPIEQATTLDTNAAWVPQAGAIWTPQSSRRVGRPGHRGGAGPSSPDFRPSEWPAGLSRRNRGHHAALSARGWPHSAGSSAGGVVLLEQPAENRPRPESARQFNRFVVFGAR